MNLTELLVLDGLLTKAMRQQPRCLDIALLAPMRKDVRREIGDRVRAHVDGQDESLAIGKKYRINYLIPGIMRFPRQMVAKVIDLSGERIVLSGRPEFGTLTLNLEWILAFEEVPESTRCYANKRMPQKSPEMTPYRVKGGTTKIERKS